MEAFWAFDKAVFNPGAISVLQKQLIAVAVALTTQCPYCIDLHLKAARHGGATDQMLAKTATVAAAMRAGAAITRATRSCSPSEECMGHILRSLLRKRAETGLDLAKPTASQWHVGRSD